MSSIDELYPLLPSRPVRHRRHNNGRPNYNQIHAQPLPIVINPLPTLIPHNPLSVLQVAYAYISQLVAPPSSHPTPRICGYYSSHTNSIHITNPSSVQLLWSRGFFGKGSLSRSEPTWLDREKKRLGLLANDTSEEHTAARREERKRFKNERARKEREAIEEKLMEELLVEKIASSHQHIRMALSLGNGSEEVKAKAGKPTLRSKYEGLAEAALLSPTKGIGFFGGEKLLPTPPMTPLRDPAEEMPPKPEEKTATAIVVPNQVEIRNVDHTSLAMNEKPAPQDIINQEHLQLTPEEAFFLVYAIGVLDIYSEPSSAPDSTAATQPITTSRILNLLTTSPAMPPNDPFFLLYTTYHHFRSLGWVVRPGLKFGVDYLLYLRGPVFSHAEFAVTILPACTHPFWRTAEGRNLKSAGSNDDGAPSDSEVGVAVGQRSWHWLHCVQRVQSQVRKTLVVAWVDIPPPIDSASSTPAKASKDGSPASDEIDITALLKRYKIREMVVKRWIPNRSRD